MLLYMKKSRSIRRNRLIRSKKSGKANKSKHSRKRNVTRSIKRRRRRRTAKRHRIIQRGGSGIGSALYNAAFVGSGPPFGVDPKSAAAQSCPGGGCDAAHYCNNQATAGNTAKGGVKLGTLCQNGAALLGQSPPPPGSPFTAMQKFKEDTLID